MDHGNALPQLFALCRRGSEREYYLLRVFPCETETYALPLAINVDRKSIKSTQFYFRTFYCMWQQNAKNNDITILYFEEGNALPTASLITSVKLLLKLREIDEIRFPKSSSILTFLITFG